MVNHKICDDCKKEFLKLLSEAIFKISNDITNDNAKYTNAKQVMEFKIKAYSELKKKLEELQ
jgi:hypothetical protein